MVLLGAASGTDGDHGDDVDRYFADKGELDLEQLKTDFATGPEPILWTSYDEAGAAVEHIPDIPITYLSALQDSDLPPEAQDIWEAGLDELLARSSNGRVIDVDGPHTLPPPPVHEAIDQMLELLGDP